MTVTLAPKNRALFEHNYGEGLNVAYQSTPALLSTLHKISDYANRTLGLALPEPPHAN